MKNFLNHVVSGLTNALERAGRERARHELLRLDPRLIEDAGLSRELLHQGIGSWPWRLKDEAEALEASRAANYAAKAEKRAIQELSAMSDKELADLAISRGDIKNVVRFGRGEIDTDLAARDKQAA
jgi:uncharacterized protein YjiS (DUF1127 family)